MRRSNNWRGQRHWKIEEITYPTQLLRMKRLNKMRGKIDIMMISNRIRNLGQRRNKKSGTIF
eukprot:6591978-Heterocapsa_arctica.AAC.1